MFFASAAFAPTCNPLLPAPSIRPPPGYPCFGLVASLVRLVSIRS